MRYLWRWLAERWLRGDEAVMFVGVTKNFEIRGHAMTKQEVKELFDRQLTEDMS